MDIEDRAVAWHDNPSEPLTPRLRALADNADPDAGADGSTSRRTTRIAELEDHISTNRNHLVALAEERPVIDQFSSKWIRRQLTHAFDHWTYEVRKAIAQDERELELKRSGR
jgi:hypothetical protein